MDLVTYMQQKVCADHERCKTRASILTFADYVDLDYDAISQSVILSAFWHASPNFGTWDEFFDIRERLVKLEVGILANEKPSGPEELSLGGFLSVLGEDSRPSKQTFMSSALN